MTIPSGRRGFGGLLTPILAILLICFIAYKAISNSPSISSTPTPTPLVTLTSAPVATIASVASIIPTLTPTPFVKIDVHEWNSHYICRGAIAISVQIDGAVISGGYPPFRIEAFYKDNKSGIPRQIASTSTLWTVPPFYYTIAPNSYRVSINPPIIAAPGKSITVTIYSNTPDQKPDWTGDLNFLSESPDCLGK